MVESLPRKNIVFCGTTGNGKSTTCNTIFGKKKFNVSGRMHSCTKEISFCDHPTLNIRMIDTPGFNDTDMDETKISEIMKKLTSIIIDIPGTSTNQVDAFVLVCKLFPRAGTLKSDLERIKGLFGSAAMKSLVLILIEDNTLEPISNSDFFTEFLQLGQIIEIISKGKNSKASQDWYVRWDNFKPYENQIDELLDKADKVKPYTHEIFILMEEELKENYKKMLDEKSKEFIKELEAKIDLSKEEKRKEIQKLKEENQIKFEEYQNQIKKTKEEYEELAKKQADKNTEALMQCFLALSNKISNFESNFSKLNESRLNSELQQNRSSLNELERKLESKNNKSEIEKIRLEQEYQKKELENQRNQAYAQLEQNRNRGFFARLFNK